MNFIDFGLLALIALLAYRGFRRGLIAEALELAGVLAGGLLALNAYCLVGAPLRWFGVGRGLANFIGGALIFVATLVATAILAGKLRRRRRRVALAPPLKVGGAVLAGTWSALLGAFLIVVASVIPASQSIQGAVPRSFVGRTVLAANSPFYALLEEYARRDVRNLVFFLRQYLARFEPRRDPPDPTQCFDIEASDEIDIEEGAESALLDLVNAERAERELSLVRPHEMMREIARVHSADMYRRGYFCHHNPEKEDPFDRIEKGGVVYDVAGENLALAPSVEMAHRGLMNSPRHRDNILRSDFTDLGIGVYKGPYGLIVTQNFCGGCR